MADVRAACEVGAEGIGLFRSEFLYLGREDYPDEEEQFAAYREALSAMPDRRVVIRTLDIGADKQASYFELGEQENPALGLRACRISLSRPQVFLTQARALLRASVFGKLAVMFPLITGEREVTGLLDLWEEAKRQLAERGMTWSESIEMGIMIETPAAAILSDRLATMVDFFSIGTNDLTQYTLAMDRQNAALSEMSQGRQESVLRLIRYTVQSARRAGIWVGVCGEIAADVTLTKELLDMGVTELSVSPGVVLALRERICTMPADSAGVEDEKEENYGHFQGK
jgi:phosphotransferase system enzyme I (PtsI)